MADEVVIRTAVPEDAQAILKLWQEMMEFHSARESFFTLRPEASRSFLAYIRERMKNAQACVAVAERRGEIVGYGMGVISDYPPVYRIDKYGQICEMAVTSSWRRSGLGGKLLKFLQDWFAIRGIRRLEVRAASANEIAEAFWRRSGFKPYMEILERSLDEAAAENV
jgi:GNAT superfamily N-acetyltransferase